MTYSLIFSALIFSIAAIIGLSRQEKLNDLRTQWDTMRERGQKHDIPENPEDEFVVSKLGDRSQKKTRPKIVNSFSKELIAFFKKNKEAEKNGDEQGLEMHQREMNLVSKMINFSTDEVGLLVAHIKSDTSLRQEHKRSLIVASIMILSQDHPKNALTLITKSQGPLLPKAYSDHVVGVSLGHLAGRDPLAAMQWLKDHQEDIGGVTEGLRSKVISGAARKDIRAAFTLMSNMTFKEQQRPYSALTAHVTAENASDYLAGVRQIKGPSNEIKRALQALANSSLWDDPATAINWLDGGEVTAEEKAPIIQSLSYEEIKEGIITWLDWFHYEGSQTATQKNEELLQNWAKADFRAAGGWINGLEQGRRRDDAAFLFATALRIHKPEAARSWAKSLPNSERKTKLLEGLKTN